jgi:hypothetical protein
MAETLNISNSTIRRPSASSRVSRGIAEIVQQKIKSAVHMELIKRLDLEKLSEIQETRAGQQQLFTLIQQLLNEQGIQLKQRSRSFSRWYFVFFHAYLSYCLRRQFLVLQLS